MASNLACVGLAISSSEELQELISRVLPLLSRVGEQNGLVVRRWQDVSGARLVFGLRAGAVVEFLPSLAAAPGAILGPIVVLNDEVSSAAILDDQGEQLTSAAFELEERGLLNETLRAGGPAAVVALGQAVTVHEDTAQFEISRDSLLDPSADLDAPAPPHYAERGLKWPPRMASESFFSNGVFQQSEAAEATARLNGVVLRSDRRVNSVTGQPFVVARVRTVGFEVDVCLPGAENAAALRPGQIVAGRVFLTASLAGGQVESQPPAAGAPTKQLVEASMRGRRPRILVPSRQQVTWGTRGASRIGGSKLTEATAVCVQAEAFASRHGRAPGVVVCVGPRSGVSDRPGPCGAFADRACQERLHARTTRAEVARLGIPNGGYGRALRWPTCDRRPSYLVLTLTGRM